MKLHLLPALACTALLLATIHAAEPIPYPSTNCIVSDEKLGEMGPPVMVDYKGQQVGFCCKSCIGDFNKDPARYLAKLQAPSAKP
jgi:YHS domain-containing protein